MTTEAASVRPRQCISEGPTSDPRLVSPCTGHLLWMQDERHKTKRELSAAHERIAELEAALKLIASGMRGDRILSEFELSEIAHKALGT